MSRQYRSVRTGPPRNRALTPQGFRLGTEETRRMRLRALAELCAHRDFASRWLDRIQMIVVIEASAG